MVSYSELLNATMTFTECKELYNADIIFILVSCIVIVIVLFVLLIYYLIKLDKCSKFIRYNNMQKKFQEWKNDNKGLIL